MPLRGQGSKTTWRPEGRHVAVKSRVTIRGSVKGMASATEDVADLVADQFFDAGTGRAEVFARIEFFGVLGEDLADAGGQGQAQVGINIDLGATGAAGDFDVGLGHAGGVVPSLPPYLLISSTRSLGTLEAPWSTRG